MIEILANNVPVEPKRKASFSISSREGWIFSIGSCVSASMIANEIFGVLLRLDEFQNRISDVRTTIDGVEATCFSPTKKRYVPKGVYIYTEDSKFFPSLSFKENMELLEYVYRRDLSNLPEQKEILANYGIDEILKLRTMRKASEGCRIMVGFAVMEMLKPRIIILAAHPCDPSHSLYPQVIQILKNYCKKNDAIVISDDTFLCGAREAGESVVDAKVQIQ